MLKNPKLEKQGIEDYKELKNIVENSKLNLTELCTELNGWNLENNRFDVNYKNICTTIYYINNKFEVLNTVELWDDENNYLYDHAFKIEQ